MAGALMGGVGGARCQRTDTSMPDSGTRLANNGADSKVRGKGKGGSRWFAKAGERDGAADEQGLEHD